MITRFFVDTVPLRIVRRFEGDEDDHTTWRTEIFNDKGYKWEDAGSLFLSIAGLGGDSDWDELTLKKARKIMGVVIPEHFSRADKFLFAGLPDGAVKTVPTKRADLKIL